MSDELALLTAIITNPDEDTPRLVFADWLQENDQPERAEFIRLQCELASLAPDDPRRPLVVRRERRLYAHHKRRWMLPLARLLPGAVMEFRRGFVETMTLPASVYRQNADAALRMTPLRDVRLTQLDDRARAVCLLPRPRTLRIYGEVRNRWTGLAGGWVELLRQAPSGLEPALLTGRYIILTWSVGSTRADEDIRSAFELAREYLHEHSSLRIAIRPFGSPEEFARWCRIEEPIAEARWLVLENGRLLEDSETRPWDRASEWGDDWSEW